MSLRPLLCVVLLLAGSALAQQNDIPAAPEQPATQSAPRPDSTANPKPDATVNKLRIECVPASRAADLIGTHGCVAGKVFRVNTGRSGNTHLHLCPSHKCSFQAVASAHDRRKVGDLTYLHGKLIAVIGDVVDYRGHPQIFVKDSEQLRVAASNPPSEFDAAQAKPNSKSTPGGKRAW